jgi:CxxC motif-containing protein (DUF1111 family)
MKSKIALFLCLMLAGVLFVKAQDALPLGGDATVNNITGNAFTMPLSTLERAQERQFFVGNSFFNQNWVQAPSSTTARDGLGTLFNARSCAGCHFKDGRGRAFNIDGENTTGFLIRLSIPGDSEQGEPVPDPIYGGQFQDQAIDGILPEGDIQITYTDKVVTFADGRTVTLRQPNYTFVNLNYGEMSADVMFSPRVANQMIGLGFLEAIPAEAILANADPDDVNNDGISGRANMVWNYATQQLDLGRFGWKANQPTLYQQVAGAFNGDMGITTQLFSADNCSSVQACDALPNGGTPEIDEDDLLKVVLYSSTLAVPAQRIEDASTVWRGYDLFQQAQCSSCHIPQWQTAEHPTISALSNQTVYPYTDLLLHDMGDELADGRPDFMATGNEWRTPPLWGIGLFETVNGHTNYLHDGRARNLLEAILWHGGEATASREAVLQMSEADVNALIEFLKSL